MNESLRVSVCEVCQIEFIREYASKKRKTCSNECKAKKRSLELKGKPMPQKCWYSAKKVITSEEYKNKRKMFYRDHPEINKGVGDRLRKYNLGRKKTELEILKIKNFLANDVRFQAGVLHVSSKEWRLRSPVNKVYIFKNLREFVRQNIHLFKDKDVIFKKERNGKSETCNAISALSHLRPGISRQESTWKGWTWYSEEEKFYNHGRDLLERKI